MMSAIATFLVAFASIMLPGFFLALALLRKTKLNMFEITVMGFIFGLIFPPTLTWVESYLIPYVHFFSFSANLFFLNVILLTIIGIVLSFQQGVLLFWKSGQSSAMERKERTSELRETMATMSVDMSLTKKHEKEEAELARRHAEEKEKLKEVGPEERKRIEEMHKEEERRLLESHEVEEKKLIANPSGKGSLLLPGLAIFGILLILMLIAFGTRIANLSVAQHFFEFDPYFDMLSTKSILVYGSQWLFDHSAWPTAVNGTPHRIEPLVPYIEAFWYDISNPPTTQISTALLTNVSSIYPPITAALLVFVVFLFLYHKYDGTTALIGAAFATAMPALITTFISGEQLVEPWGIFAMFFFYACYLLAVQDMKDKRYAILAGIAFASTFLGAHYYTVNAGVFAIYILLQGVIDVFRKKEMMDFYKMNAIVIFITALFYAAFGPYKSVLFDRLPSIFGIPVIISFPLIALILVALFDYGPKVATKRKYISSVNKTTYLAWLLVLAVFAAILVFLTPLGAPVERYIALSYHFTTPSIALFMTVQEYAPTGFNFNFGSAGFGIIGASIGGVNIIVWLVLILFTALEGYAIYERDSKASILAVAAVWPLAVAGLIEIKYLPHFGVAYILAICCIIGELLYLAKGDKNVKRAILIFSAVLVLVEMTSILEVAAAASQPNCASLILNNSLGANLFCNQVPTYWLQATAWMSQNVGPFAPRVLSWWDYGDWINWFGNSNAVLRGDNAIAKLDYQTAARFVLGQADGYGPGNLSNFSSSIQAKYILFDDQLTQKWQALDFLACIGTNQTSRAFAVSQAQGSGVPYALGQSQCELNHDPAYILLPFSNILQLGNDILPYTTSVNNYCTLPGLKIQAIKGMVLAGHSFLNQTLCVPINYTSPVKAIRVLYQNGTVSNILLVPTSQFYFGSANISNQNYIFYMALYLPNSANGTITNAPTQFYDSNYYRGFYLGQLPGFSIAYPQNFAGINFVNSTSRTIIYQVNNYTGSLPYVTPKPSWVNNNFTMPA